MPITHKIIFNDQVVTCCEHTDETVTALVKRYYEGKYGYHCTIKDAQGKIIYTTA